MLHRLEQDSATAACLRSIYAASVGLQRLMMSGIGAIESAHDDFNRRTGQSFFYHDPSHTIKVLNAGLELAIDDGTLTTRECEVLAIAAVFHDCD
jgi:hypothetical protein